MTSGLILLAVAWIAWCVLHSLLVATGVRRALERRLGSRARYYRLGYNGIATATLLPVVWLTWRVDGPIFFDWWGAMLPVSLVLFTASGVLFLGGAKTYDSRTFLGLDRIQGTPTGRGLAATGAVSRRGILGRVRHPWYAAGILLVWVGPKNASLLVTAVVLTVYQIVGAFVEERKLVAEFGEEYRRYQREVPMFVPRLGRRRKA